MLNLKNQFIMAPIKLGYSDGKGNITPKHIDFYTQRSPYLGAIALEPLYMDAGLRELPTQLGIDSDDKITGYQELIRQIHKTDTKVIAHLNHPGRMANPKIPGNYFWSSTDKACPNGGAKPKRMDREMMDKVIQMHIQSAERAQKAGFDFIEIQFGHGYLMAQFLSPETNDRNDEYGGSFENRMRYPLELLRAVKAKTNLPILARISGDEMIPNGFHLPEMISFAQKLEKEGIEAIHVTAGSACSTPPWFFQHMFIPKGKTWEFAAKIKEQVKVPVIFVGRINSSKDVDLLKEKYKADYLALGRALVADQDFVGKYLKQTEGQIRPCLACSEGCLGGVKQGKGLGCVVNPLVNTGYQKPQKAEQEKIFAIVGAGLAGMQAAITLKERGYDVDLYEKEQPGGQFNLAYLPPKKESLKEIVDYYKNELIAQGVNLIIEEATAEKINQKNYDAVILATGAIPATPPISGLKKYYWTEFLNDDQLPKNEKVLVVGGGLIGLEVASKLVDGNNQIIVVEMLDEIARGMEMIEKTMTLKRLQENKVAIYLKHQVVKIEEDKVLLKHDEGELMFDGIQKIIITAGMKSYIPFKDTIKAPVYTVGDAKQVGKAQEAIHEAYELALNL
ncbi:MAG: FAD-dependent oxidoreductase [Bacteroidales bacterium]|nr:FAD-dependent oxidoreductase [Bacteroidales bacterium]